MTKKNMAKNNTLWQKRIWQKECGKKGQLYYSLTHNLHIF